MNMAGKLKAFGELVTNVLRKPVTVEETFGFVAENFRWLPRRDADKCTGCGACNERCSSGATCITDANGERTISIDGLRCIFCGRCADVCPENALDLTIENTPPAPGVDPALRVSLSRGSEEPGPTVDSTLILQKCIVCGEVMPVTEKHLDIIKEMMLVNLKPDTVVIVEKDMERYLRTCISCRRKYSLEWDTHPRKFI